MSEKIRPEEAVRTALDLESQIARTLESDSETTARKGVRAQLEQWMSLMDDPKVAKAYGEQLGGVDPAAAKQEMLTQLGGRFPRVAQELGWDASVPSVDQAA